MKYKLLLSLAALLVLSAAARADQLPSKALLFNHLKKEYCTFFNEDEDNNGWSFCKDSGGGPAPDGPLPRGDIDIEGILFKDTLKLDDPATYAAVQAIGRNLLQPDLHEKTPDNLLDTVPARQKILKQQHVAAARNLAYHAFTSQVARRQAIPPATLEQMVAANIASGAPGPMPASPAPTPTPGSSGPGKFDWAIGDSIANGVQHAGHLGGGQCPDNNNASCGFFNCNPTANSVGATCVSRTASNILNSVIPRYCDDIRGKNIVFSTGLSNQPSACANGTNHQMVVNQLNALKNTCGAAHVVVLGTYKGMRKGPDKRYIPGSVREDLAVLNTCVRNGVEAFNNPTVTYIDGFDNAGVPEAANDTIHPTDKKAYLALAEAALNTMMAASAPAPAPGETPPPAPDSPGGMTRPECEYTYDFSSPTSQDHFIAAVHRQEGAKQWNIRTFPGKNQQGVLIYPNYLGAFQIGEVVLSGPAQGCVVKDCDVNNNNYGGDPDACNPKDRFAYKERAAAAAGQMGMAGAFAAITPAMLQAERWTGRCGGVDGIHNSIDYLNCPRAQVGAFKTLHFNNPIPGACMAIMCQEVGGVYVTASGIRAAMHLKGSQGAANWCLDPNGDHTDAYGTSAASYVKKLGGYYTRSSDPPCGSGRTYTGTVPGTGSLAGRESPGDMHGRPDPGYPLGPPKLVAEVVREIRQKAGVPDDRIAESPSYNEIMQAMTKEKFLNPSYYKDITGDPGALMQEQTMIENYINLQLKDIYDMQEQINALLAARASLKYNKKPYPKRIEKMQME